MNALRGLTFNILPEGEDNPLRAFQPVALDVHTCQDGNFMVTIPHKDIDPPCDAAPASPSPWEVEASDVARRWLVDSGTWEDLATEDSANPYQRAVVEVPLRELLRQMGSSYPKRR